MSTWRTASRKITKEAGLPDLRFHDLRHHAITELAESLTSDAVTMSIAGHVSQRMLAHYSHVRLDAKRKLWKFYQEGFQGQLRPKARPKYWVCCCKSLKQMAGPTRLELATSCVTGRRSNRLNYGPAVEILGWWVASGVKGRPPGFKPAPINIA
jgi:hypothetical protein